ncbi:rhamnan synthesis F family protein [Streptococcus parasanguinis]|uniref:rhamnan synthesis F family protein n=1 Tax=Streptococcus TaxID=1301 RepID=UPI00066BBD9C|nr:MULTISPECIES: rhamnan synthesis F family protein [Streptococcus]MDU3001425.1 rhamnan synthesis F family protein [Streptococcus parasanguinis]MDU4888245.1 rhamnan synthesis F family protein [Streptococcus parasanguinis]OFN90855.1 rhamnosyltransferase [Streptococcus sp. HMSC057G03]
MNRILLYIHYNKFDEVSEHVLYQLEQIKPLFSRVILISNSRLEKNYMRKLEMIGITEIIQRANIGFDFAAWRDGMEYVGFDHLEKYDSVTLMNDTCIGPLWPLEPYFRSFESAIDCDFWGMTNFKKTKYFREHVQSYFVSYSREVVSSKVFKSFWMNVKSYDNVRQVIDNYETKFTSELKRTGFNYQVVFNTLGEKSDDMLHPDFSYYRPFDILNHRVPFLKIKALQSHQEQANQLKCEIKSISDFPSEILENVYSSIEFFSNEIVRNEKISIFKKVVNKLKRVVERS